MYQSIVNHLRSTLIVLVVLGLPALIFGAPVPDRAGDRRSVMDASVPLNIRAGGYDSVGNYRVYRMMTSTDNACHVYYLPPIQPILDNFPRVAGVTLYQATQSIIFEPGFVSEDGASFIAEIVPATYGVPPATNLTGTADNNMNWTQATAYDENGNVIDDSKSFFDNSGRNVQSQTKVFYRTPSGAEYTHVLASQLIRDAYGREAAATLPAPIDYADFSYRPNFAQHNSAGVVYSHQNFDLYNSGSGDVDKTNAPEPLWDGSSGSGPAQGTLAWYYSTSNNWEPYIPMTNYPYSRQSYYRDGTGTIKKSAGSGDQLRMGLGREGSNYTTPVINELEYYTSVRNHYFTTADLGVLPSSLSFLATQQVARDANGREVVAIQDKNSQTLMTARPGTDLLQTANTVTLNALPYSLTMPAAPSGAGCSLVEQVITLYGNGKTFTLTNPANQTITVPGPIRGGTLDFTAGPWGLVIRSDEPFNIVYSDEQGSGCGFVAASLNSQIAEGASKVHYFKILADNTSVTLTGNYTLTDMSTEATTSLLTGNLLNRGYYKVVANTGSVTLTYGNSFTDVSYNFYNQKGLLVASIDPEGVKKLYTGGFTTYATKTDLPFTTLYTYDVQDRLVSVKDPDGGLRQSFYRMDGKIRFSQNAIQAVSGSYSYTNYDAQGRIIESGQYQPDAGGLSLSNAVRPSILGILENTGPTGGLTTGTKTDVSVTQYDVPDATHGVPNYVQDAFNLSGAVSVTKKYSSIVNNSPGSANLVSATWYNYDEEGKMIWAIKYINGLGYKTTDYTYDVLGNLVKKVFQAGQADAFTHLYDYDPVNKQLLHVSTSVGAANPVLQATYYYYLNGGLKRVELANKLQGIDYVYTLGGALKSINNSNKTQDPGNDGSANGFFADAFGEVLDYYNGDYVNGRNGVASINGVNASAITTESYAGNIKAMSWYSEKPVSTGLGDAPTTYVYQYDPKYQFTESTWGTELNFGNTPTSFTTTSFNKEKVGNVTGNIPAYDGNGNIQYLQRTDASGNLTDQFSYHYDNHNNQLTSVVNAASSTPYATYSYDALGQVTGMNTGDANQQYMVYDVTGKVTTVYRDAAHTQQVAGFVYNETGERIKKIGYNSSGQINKVTYYEGDVIYTQVVTNGTYESVIAQEYQITGSSRLGVYYPQTPIYAYEMSDHLGNVRAVIAVNSNTLEVRAYSDYYPYGRVINPSGTDEYRYGYQGQNAEKDPETGLNVFQLRMYDSRIARWLQYDPAGQFYSPYMGMGNNPVSGVDPDGGTDDDFIKRLSDGSIFWADDPENFTDASKYLNLGPIYNDALYKYSWDEKLVTRPILDLDNVETVSTYHPSYWQQQENGGFGGKMWYNLVNSFYVTVQNLGGKQLSGSSLAFNLDGSVTTPNQNVDAFATVGTSFVPFGGAAKGATAAAAGVKQAGFQGVYVFEYILNGVKKEYVGKSIDVVRRIYQHTLRIQAKNGIITAVKDIFDLTGATNDGLKQFEQMIIDSKGGIGGGKLGNLRNAHKW